MRIRILAAFVALALPFGAQATVVQGERLAVWEPDLGSASYGATLNYFVYGGSSGSVASAVANTNGNYNKAFADQHGGSSVGPSISWQTGRGDYRPLSIWNKGTWRSYYMQERAQQGETVILYHEQTGINLATIDSWSEAPIQQGLAGIMSNLGGDPRNNRAGIVPVFNPSAPGVAPGQTVSFTQITANTAQRALSLFDVGPAIGRSDVWARYDVAQNSVFLDGAYRGTAFAHQGYDYVYDATFDTLTITQEAGDLSLGSTDFGAVLVRQSGAGAVEISNGGTPLSRLTGTVAAGSNTALVHAGDASFDIVGGGSHRAEATFSPTQRGETPDAFAINSNDPNAPTEASLTGQGVAPELDAVGAAQLGGVFGSVAAGAPVDAAPQDDTDAQTVTVTARRGQVVRFALQVANRGDGEAAALSPGDAGYEDMRLRYSLGALTGDREFRAGALGGGDLGDLGQADATSGMAHIIEFRPRSNSTFGANVTLTTENGDPTGTNQGWSRDIALQGSVLSGLAGIGGVIDLGGVGFGSQCGFQIQFLVSQDTVACGGGTGSLSDLAGFGQSDPETIALRGGIAGWELVGNAEHVALFDLLGFSETDFLLTEGLAGLPVTLAFDAAAARDYFIAEGLFDGLFAFDVALEVYTTDGSIWLYDIVATADINGVVPAPGALALALIGIGALAARRRASADTGDLESALKRKRGRLRAAKTARALAGWAGDAARPIRQGANDIDSHYRCG